VFKVCVVRDFVFGAGHPIEDVPLTLLACSDMLECTFI
jgi:hypothetical protein